MSILAGILFFLQGFGRGGVIATLGLVLDLTGFVLFLVFVLVSCVILLKRESAPPGTAAESSKQLHFHERDDRLVTHGTARPVAQVFGYTVAVLLPVGDVEFLFPPGFSTGASSHTPSH